MSTSGKEMDGDNHVGQANGCIEKYIGGIDNRSYMHSCFGSTNEFDASIFGMNPSQYIGPPISTPLGMKIDNILSKFGRVVTQNQAIMLMVLSRHDTQTK